MSSTNKTTNYNLSQFVGTDVPSYLGDYNSDMSKIDKAIGDVANSQGSVEQSVVGLTADVQGLSTQVSGVSTSVQQLQTSVAQIDTAYKQADTALSQRITANANNIQANTTAIESANTAIESANTAIEGINTAIGTGDISGIGDGTIKGAISNLNSNLNTSNKLIFSGANGEGNIPITDANYDFLDVVFGDGSYIYGSIKIRKGETGTFRYITRNGTNMVFYNRNVKLSEDGTNLQISIATSFQQGNNNDVPNDIIMVIKYIYACKNE